MDKIRIGKVWKNCCFSNLTYFFPIALKILIVKFLKVTKFAIFRKKFLNLFIGMKVRMRVKRNWRTFRIIFLGEMNI